jgi:hypothetical protein
LTTYGRPDIGYMKYDGVARDPRELRRLKEDIRRRIATWEDKIGAATILGVFMVFPVPSLSILYSIDPHPSV